MLLDKISDHYKNKNCIKVIRSFGKKNAITSTGYIVEYSDDFILLQEASDFKLSRYYIFPTSQLKKIRFSKSDQYYNQIMILEGEAEKVGINYNVDLTNWQTVFKSIKAFKFVVIVECENPEINSFTIGPIIKASKKSVYICDFDTAGFLDETPTSIDLENITSVQFNDHYANVFSKYLRHKKSKK